MKENNTENKFTNQLINASSPYLLQHANNPVHWVTWSDEAFRKAKEENKLVLISIGYSACHWCHVMEHESFENEEVASIMNKHFICIKVDREERPDVDQIYMTAVQLMTQQGGWPLNCFALPNGQPIYGGTYFPKEQWINVLQSLAETYKNNRKKVIEYAEKLTAGIKQAELIDTPVEVSLFSVEKIHELVKRWKLRFDNENGGVNSAPKFPLPNNYDFLLNYGVLFEEDEILNYVNLSLFKMMMGGIYDQVGGGFARYSVDMLWKVPHFEKMLYDNAQLISTLSNAYCVFKNEEYKKIVYQTFSWLNQEMKDKEGGFYAALDADSEGVEGKFYVWTKTELIKLLSDDFEWVKDYYNINKVGYWESDNYILLRKESDEAFAEKQGWTQTAFRSKLRKVNDILLEKRNLRIPPGLDDKRLTAWNAMTLKGYVDAFLAFGEIDFLKSAIGIAEWIEKFQIKSDYSLWHTRKNKESTIDGFLEDYAHVMDAFITLYDASFEEKWIHLAHELLLYTKSHFRDENTKMFYFTPKDSKLIARKTEVNDNVIPSSNSVMAKNLFKLGVIFHNDNYIDDAKQMLANVYEDMDKYGSGYSNWGQLALYFSQPYFEIAIVGENAKFKRTLFGDNYIPNVLFMGGEYTAIPSLKDKFQQASGETLIYVCVNKTCRQPLKTVEEALKEIQTLT